MHRMKFTIKIKNKLLGIIPFALVLVLWYVFYYFEITPQWLIPSPYETFLTLIELIKDGTIFELVLISATNAIPAFLLSLIAAVLLGTLIGINETIRKICFPFLSAFYPIPSLAWLPLIILFLGFTKEAIWVVIFISSFRKIIYNVIAGVRNVKGSWILAGKNLGLSRFEIVMKIILPGAFPQIMTGIRMGFGSSWRSLISAEMLIAAAGGIGKFIWMAQWFLSFEKVIIGIAIIALIGLGIEELVFKKLEKKTLGKWGFIQE